MLLLSRRTKERISFPESGITIHFNRLDSGKAEVGIEAPMHIQIVCGDSDAHTDQAVTHEELVQLPREVRHAIRNELQMISVGVHLFKEQLRLGLEEDAEKTFDSVVTSLKTIDAIDVLRRPETQDA